MSRFVLDCSVTMAWCFEDEADRYADRVLDALESVECMAPTLWLLEVSNVLLMAERRKRLKEADTLRFIELLKSLPVVVDDNTSLHELESILSVARDFGVTAYDAAYLELAMRQGVPLATCDRQLKEACKKSGVLLFK